MNRDYRHVYFINDLNLVSSQNVGTTRSLASMPLARLFIDQDISKTIPVSTKIIMESHQYVNRFQTALKLLLFNKLTFLSKRTALVYSTILNIIRVESNKRRVRQQRFERVGVV